jgi:hypothetical protein
METGAEIGSSNVYEYTFRFRLHDDKIFVGSGYSTGKIKDSGDIVQIVYKQENPEKFRAVDLRSSLFGGYGGSVFILVFQAFGILLLYSGVRKTISHISILKNGKIANGKLLKMEPPDKEINPQTLYYLTFEFNASNNETCNISFSFPGYKVSRLTDEGYEMLVYDPASPEKAIFLDQLPKRVKNVFLRLV